MLWGLPGVGQVTAETTILNMDQFGDYWVIRDDVSLIVKTAVNYIATKDGNNIKLHSFSLN